jgi:hypothetical protein
MEPGIADTLQLQRNGARVNERRIRRMSTNTSTVTRGYRNSVLFVVIAGLLVVPPIVRATATITSSSPIRLNRGFETAPSKGNVVTSPEQASAPGSAHEPELPHVRPLLLARDDFRATVAPSDHSPDPQRGPPAVALR